MEEESKKSVTSTSTASKASSSKTGTAKSTTSRTGTRKTTTTTPPSAEEKLKKSMKGLSYMGGGSGGSLDTGAKLDTKEKTERKKVGGVVLDLDTIADANKQKFDTKGRRNNVIILVLSLLLVVSLVYLIIAIIGYRQKLKEPNLRYYVEGSAVWSIEGGPDTKFMMKQGVMRDTIYVIDADLTITTEASVQLVLDIKFTIDGQETFLPGLYEINENLIRVDKSNKFVYQNTITGGGTIDICNGFDFRDAPAHINSRNIYLEVTAIVTPV